MNEHTRNNRAFDYADEFRRTIQEFFTITWPSICQGLRGRINDHFQKVNPGF